MSAERCSERWPDEAPAMTARLRTTTNIMVAVGLTATGRRLLKAYEDQFPPQVPRLAPGTDGRYEFHLWELAHIFGPGLGLGLPVPFDENTITLVVPAAQWAEATGGQ